MENLAQGLLDRVSISDARVSTITLDAAILHLSPEPFSGGSFALVQNGARMALNGHPRTTNSMVCAVERRRPDASPPLPLPSLGCWTKLSVQTMTGGEQGANLKGLVARRRTSSTKRRIR